MNRKITAARKAIRHALTKLADYTPMPNLYGMYNEQPSSVTEYRQRQTNEKADFTEVPYIMPQEFQGSDMKGFYSQLDLFSSLPEFIREHEKKKRQETTFKD